MGVESDGLIIIIILMAAAAAADGPRALYRSTIGYLLTLRETGRYTLRRVHLFVLII